MFRIFVYMEISNTQKWLINQKLNRIRDTKEELLKEFGGNSFLYDNELVAISKIELGRMLNEVKWNKAFDYWFTDNNFNPKSNKEYLIEMIKKEFNYESL